ncbi:BLUF domain-containing protein [Hymenobacter setariae]|uniref:BLUF domain-containing protein n=1 Tax=Hymenobacter setariae TaxID=2594794 RepID=A0A558BRY7_9BACT|nr:BLUF domain-containing protein [Hymenobacter setariae]TVT39286.1 BLUF domain-containing protein [Hymenobacter setariae]
MKEPETEAKRRRAIAWAVALTAETHLAPEQYEWELLECYAKGTLTLDQVLQHLDTQIHHVLYRSKAVRLFTKGQLTDLLEQSRAWNEAHNLTGLLCYSSDGHFVQVLEGPAAEVRALFAKIRQDTRHYRVQALSNRATPLRWFADWRMAFTQVAPADFYWLIGYLEARGHNLVLPQLPVVEPHLLTLLDAFQKL